MKVYINGKIFPKEQASISVFDHGLLYGDGVFEGIRVYRNKIFKLKEHLDRLYESARTILLTIPMTKQEMTQAVVDTVGQNPYEDAYIRLVITRGVGSLGLDPNKCQKPQVIIIVDKISLYSDDIYRDGMQIITATTRKINPDALPPWVKSLNYLNNILAKIEAIQSGYQEAIMLNDRGFVAECTGDNIFYFKGNELITPSLDSGLLNGITRRAVMDLAKKMDFEVLESTVVLHDLYNADECFLTGTAAGVVPVVKVDGRVIGTGRPGEKTMALSKKYEALTKKEGTPVLRKK